MAATAIVGHPLGLGAPLLHAGVAAPAAITYSNVNLDIPAPVPDGELPAQEELVSYKPVKALSRGSYTFTPQVTEVHHELKINEKSYDVGVPKPVFKTQEVTPIHHKYVPEPYDVPVHYSVPTPVGVPHPVRVPVPHPVAVPVAAPVGYAGYAGYAGAAIVA
ncbi:uncharacterized protein LOC143039198 [Oratosquilla oratoria]|uniref:uncharacterized protein LOC143039196 n=1 Tax=Oratosquilla oratoria TaxID=337810 RepID=UPI003F77007C